MRPLSKTLDQLITQYPESENIIRPFGNFLICQEELLKELKEARFPKADNSVCYPLEFKQYPFSHKENLFFINPLIRTMKESFPHFKEEIKLLEKPLKLKAFYIVCEKYLLDAKSTSSAKKGKDSAREKIINDYILSLTKGEKAVISQELLKEKGENIKALVGLLLYKLKQLILTHLLSDVPEITDKDSCTCPYCAGKPSTSIIHKKDNSRDLLCADCGRLWRYNRIACPNCGVDSLDNLEMIYIDDNSNERAVLCSKCEHYIIEIDIRERDLPLEHVNAFILALTHLDILMQDRNAKQI